MTASNDNGRKQKKKRTLAYERTVMFMNLDMFVYNGLVRLVLQKYMDECMNEIHIKTCSHTHTPNKNAPDFIGFVSIERAAASERMGKSAALTLFDFLIYD